MSPLLTKVALGSGKRFVFPQRHQDKHHNANKVAIASILQLFTSDSLSTPAIMIHRQYFTHEGDPLLAYAIPPP